jgi:hypothetical protein
MSQTKSQLVGNVHTSASFVGVVTAASFSGSGANLTGIAATNNVRTNSLVVSGVSTLGTVIVGGATTQLIVNGDARVTGILTIGTSSITLNGSTNQINVGTGLTITSTEILIGSISIGSGALTGTATSATNIPNLTGAITSVNKTTSLGSFSSSNLETALTNKTGTGVAVFDTSPTLVTPALTSPEMTSAPYVNGSYRGNIVAVPNYDIDCSAGNYFTKTINGTSTFTFSNIPTSRSYSFTLCITHDSGTITWPASVKWPQNTSPVLTTYRNHKFMFSTYNGGTVWYGAALPNYSY